MDIIREPIILDGDIVAMSRMTPQVACCILASAPMVFEVNSYCQTRPKTEALS
ncbi:hypothetical protein IQ254_29055 [Nodosilinea sp. LEGE 07088]|uniref:hypothetical protein n=1 Tax=Nodosilinea sp. LEGE 07088 TaxID=2777968 RepID=UPI00187ED86E|nr:hypothetical protein [Nodosilinea sp. LEGE 07088]MBE9141203.1 hypothetical protein [Nodosilinea sp. LEGE 07088]